MSSIKKTTLGTTQCGLKHGQTQCGKAAATKSDTSRRPHAERSESLVALVSAALALPGLPAHGEDAGYRVDDPVLAYTHAQYKESDERMTIRADYLTLTLPVADRYEVKLGGIRDITAGASPVFNSLGPDGEPFTILKAGASIRDKRLVKSIGGNYYGDNHFAGVNFVHSKEDDYESKFLSLNYRYSFNDKLTSLIFGLGYSRDDVWNETFAGKLLDEPYELHQRRKRDLLVGINHITDKNTVWQFNISNSYSFGHLSDPYKKVYVDSESELRGFSSRDIENVFTLLEFADNAYLDENTNLTTLLQTLAIQLGPEFAQVYNLLGVNGALQDLSEIGIAIMGASRDSRPDEREVWLAVLRYSHYLESWDSAIHIDYRYGHDEWKANSHTLELKWNKPLKSGWQFSPGIRYYTQESADFYYVYLHELGGRRYYTSDYRLAGFGALSAKLEFSGYITDDTRMQINYEHYYRRKSFELSNSRGDAIDDYEFDSISVSFETKF